PAACSTSPSLTLPPIPYTTRFRSQITDHVTRHGGSVLYASIEMGAEELQARRISLHSKIPSGHILLGDLSVDEEVLVEEVNQSLDRKSTRLNSSHVSISYAVFCLK